MDEPFGRLRRRRHDTVCALAVDTENPGKITQFLGDLVSTLESVSGNPPPPLNARPS